MYSTSTWYRIFQSVCIHQSWRIDTQDDPATSVPGTFANSFSTGSHHLFFLVVVRLYPHLGELPRWNDFWVGKIYTYMKKNIITGEVATYE